MNSDKFNDLEQLETRICKLQTTNIALQDKLKEHQKDFDNTLDDYALKIIDVLDMIETIKSNVNLDDDKNLNLEFIIKKIERRLVNVLQYYDVEEITFADNQIQVGATRVLETQKQPLGNNPAGTIIKVCRKGYRCGDKILRPADVITAA